jgi:hypothetical protein
VTADRHTTEQAPGKPLSAPVSASTPEVGVSGGSGPLNGPQTGAESLDGGRQPRGPVDWARQQAAEREQRPPGDLQQRIAAAIFDTPAGYPNDIAAAIWRVVGREIERMKVLVAASESDGHAVRMAAQYADKAIENGERAERAEAAIERVREEVQWLRRNYPGLTQLHSRLDAALDPPAHNAGPSVAECAQADRRWPLEKHGE